MSPRTPSSTIRFVAVLVILAGVCAGAAPIGQQLLTAVKTGDSRTVRQLITQGVDVRQAQGDGMTGLHWAAHNDDIEMARVLIGAGATIGAKTRLEAITPLFLACVNGSPGMIRLLLEAGADPNGANGLGATALMQAAASGNVDAVRLLLDRSTDPNAVEPVRGQTALMFAAALDRAEVISMLVARGADLNRIGKVSSIGKPQMDEDGNPIPSNAKDSRTGRGTVANIAANAPRVMGGFSALHYAARDGKTAAMRTLVEAGADVNAVTAGDSSSALVVAISNGHFDIARYLVERKADPNVKNVDGLAALYAVLEAQWSPATATLRPITAQDITTHLELMKLLLDRGADPNARITKQLWFSPLHANSMWVKPVGATPFWRAAQATDVAAMKLLVAHGADPKLQSAAQDTPLHMAAGVGWAGNFSTNAPEGFMPSVKHLVEEIGIDVNAVDTQGYTAVMGAAFRGDNAVIQYLVDHGADLKARTAIGWVVTDFANAPSLRSSVPLAHPDTIALLRKLGAPELTKVDDEEILGIIKRKIPDPKKPPEGQDKKPK